VEFRSKLRIGSDIGVEDENEETPPLGSYGEAGADEIRGEPQGASGGDRVSGGL